MVALLSPAELGWGMSVLSSRSVQGAGHVGLDAGEQVGIAVGDACGLVAHAVRDGDCGEARVNKVKGSTGYMPVVGYLFHTTGFGRIPSHNGRAAMARLGHEGMEAVNEEGLSHQVGLHLPHSADTRMPQEGAVPAGQARGGRSAEAALRAQGLRGAGGRHLRRPRARLRAHAPEARRERRDGLREGEERDGAEGPPPRVGEGGREGQDVLGYHVSAVGLNEEAIRRYVAEQEEGPRFE